MANTNARHPKHLCSTRQCLGFAVSFKAAFYDKQSGVMKTYSISDTNRVTWLTFTEGQIWLNINVVLLFKV